MNYLKHKNYTGSVEYNEEDGVFNGKIIDIDDLVTYEANSVNNLSQSFISAVDDYIETCRQLKK